MGPHSQQQLAVKAKSQEFKVTSSKINIKSSHRHPDGRRSTLRDLQTHPDVFTSRINRLLGVFFRVHRLDNIDKDGMHYNRCSSEPTLQTKPTHQPIDNTILSSDC